MLASLLIGGCATNRPASPDNRYCYRARVKTGSKSICVPGSVPGAAAEAQAKRFEPVAGRLVIYVVRHRWGDTVNTVQVGISGGPMVPTVPASLVRLDVQPGAHRLAFDWAKGHGDLEVRGAAGQVVLVDLIGSLWFWNEWYRLEVGEPSIRARAMKSRLVADLRVDDQG